MNLKNKLLLLGLVTIIIINLNSIYSLEMLEPITKDMAYINTVDVGFVTQDEPFLVSFLLDKGEDYNTIKVKKDIDKIIIEPVRKTEESIFTSIKIDKISGSYILDLLLEGKEKNKEIHLKMFITDDVIYSSLIPYDEKTKFGKEKKIRFNIINKSITTKKIDISSNLSENWFDPEIGIKKRVSYLIQPNSVKEVSYSFIPKTIGEKEISIKIYKDYNKKNNLFNKSNNNIINYDIKINVIKNIYSIYRSQDYFFPLFGINTLPIYFFNKIIKEI